MYSIAFKTNVTNCTKDKGCQASTTAGISLRSKWTCICIAPRFPKCYVVAVAEFRSLGMEVSIFKRVYLQDLSVLEPLYRTEVRGPGRCVI